MSALKRIEVAGWGAAVFLQRICTGDVDKSVGSVTYCLLLDHDGGIRSDITVARLGRDLFQVGGPEPGWSGYGSDRDSRSPRRRT